MTAERRLFPRYPIVVPVDVRIHSGDSEHQVAHSSINIARTSLEVRCDNRLIELVLAQDSYPHTCQVNFSLPEDDRIFTIDSKVFTHRRLSQNEYCLVLVFPEHAGEEGQELGEALEKIAGQNKD